jgi:putative serine protease PepD
MTDDNLGEQRGENTPPSPWSAEGAGAQRHEAPPPPGEQVLFGSAAPGQPQPNSEPAPAPHYPTGAQPPQTIMMHSGQSGIGYFGQSQVPAPRRRTGRFVTGIAILALVVGGAAGGVGGYLAADSQSQPSISALDVPPPAKQTSAAVPGSIESVAEKLLPSVVQLQVRGRTSAGEGSGFLISSDGLIVTNNHVVADAADRGEIRAVFQDGSRASASIVGRDPTSDLAVVKADGVTGKIPVTLGRSDDLKVGQAVVAVGSPFELSGTVTSGIVSSLHRPTRAGGDSGDQTTVMDAIQTDAAINPGNSGGPLVNMQGQVIGINSAIYSPRQSGEGQGAGSVGIGFAIPIDQARRTADEIVKTGKATQTVLGVKVQDDPQGGATVIEVTPGGAAERAGIAVGDVVTRLGDRKIDSSDALVAAVRSHAPGDKVTLTIGESRNAEVTLAGQQVEPK